MAMKKKFGQNFIFDTNLLAALACDADIDGKTVVEIGVGAGTLTQQLALRAKKVIGFEIDTDLKEEIADRLKDCQNADVRFGDFMQCDLSRLEEEIGGEYCVAANLPYYITTPIICRFLEEAQNVQSMTVMVQEEVAERFCAPVGSKRYGAITVAIRTQAEAKIVRRVNRKMFFPVPNVDSAVVKIDFHHNIPQDKRVVLREVTKSAFAMRRKTLANNLAESFHISKQTAAELLKDCGLGETVRGETLSPQDFIRLSTYLKDKGVL